MLVCPGVRRQEGGGTGLLLGAWRPPVTRDYPLCGGGGVSRANELNLPRCATAGLEHLQRRNDRVDVILLENVGQGPDIGVIHCDDGYLELCLQVGVRL